MTVHTHATTHAPAVPADPLERALDQAVDEWPPAWTPQPGDRLIGTIRQYSIGQSAFGPVHTVIVERDDSGRVSVWLSSTVLLALFRQHRPKTGERIGLRYFGKHTTKGYRKYALVVDRPDGGPTFEELGGERGTPEAADGENVFF